MTTNVLLHHSVPGAGFDPDPAVTQQTGARLHLPTRPGYGGTPAAPPSEPPGLLRTAEEIVSSLRSSGVSRLDLVVGWSGGGHYALAMAAVAPELVGTVALIGTPAHDDDVPWIPDHLRPAVEALRADPGTALAMLSEQLDGIVGDLGMVCAGPDDDALLDADAGLAARLTEVMGAAFESGPAGMAADIVAQHVTPWGFEASDITRPVRLVYGEGDPLVPAVHGEHWASVLPRASLDLLPVKGHLAPLVATWPALLQQPLLAAPGPRQGRRAER